MEESHGVGSSCSQNSHILPSSWLLSFTLIYSLAHVPSPLTTSRFCWDHKLSMSGKLAAASTGAEVLMKYSRTSTLTFPRGLALDSECCPNSY